MILPRIDALWLDKEESLVEDCILMYKVHKNRRERCILTSLDVKGMFHKKTSGTTKKRELNSYPNHIQTWECKFLKGEPRYMSI